MMKIDPKYVDQVRAATGPGDLYAMLQNAIELEHATIPTYLCALYTLKLGTNQAVADIIRSVVIEEMLHMSIAANLLIAIGGAPKLNDPAFVPSYPGPLPMNIGDGLIVPLEKCSIAQVQNVFMKIEEPEHPLELEGAALMAATPEYNTIGEFYTAIKVKLTELVETGKPVFIGDFAREMVNNSWFPPDQLFRITNLDSACKAIDLIICQGEGTSVSPVDPENVAAHYYRFEQIVRGRRLVADASAPNGYSYTGAPVVLDERNVINMQPNPNPDELPAGSRARRLATEFEGSYTRLLNALDRTFNGAPDSFDGAMGLMYEMRLLAQEVLATPVPGQEGLYTGLSFRFRPL